jgi:ribosomal-protein-alanine N-acetyltransferase
MRIHNPESFLMKTFGCSYIVREGDEGDFEAFEQIERQTSRLPWTAYSLVSEFSKDGGYGLYVAENHGRVIGHALYRIKMKLNGAQGADRSRINLYSLAVAPAYQGIGVGSGLLLRLAARLVADQRPFIELFVRVSNIRAIRLYNRHGYRINRTVPNYYVVQEEDAFAMRQNRKDASRILKLITSKRC